MKNFKFRYASILTLLENKEESARNELGKAYGVLNEEKNKLSELIIRDKDYSEFIKDKASSGCKLIFLRNSEVFKKELNEKIGLQNKIISQKEEEIDTIKNALIDIMKEKKIMEKLKEKKLDEYNVTLKKIEENTIDQLVTYKNSLLHR